MNESAWLLGENIFKFKALVPWRDYFSDWLKHLGEKKYFFNSKQRELSCELGTEKKIKNPQL